MFIKCLQDLFLTSFQDNVFLLCFDVKIIFIWYFLNICGCLGIFIFQEYQQCMSMYSIHVFHYNRVEESEDQNV